MKPSTRARKFLHEEIADALMEEIARTPARRLPSLRRLGMRFQASYVTVSKAIQLLKRQGLLTVSQGRGITVVRPPTHKSPAPAPDGSAEDLAQRIEDTVASGLYRMGQALPKYSHFTVGEHKSSTTVARAYASLEAKGIIHKRGQRWVVGPRQARYPDLVVATHGGITAPTVLLLIAGNPQALVDLNGEHLRPFIGEFLSQLHRFHIRCILVRSEPEPSAEPMFACGKREIQSLIQACKGHFLGTLIAGQVSNFPGLKGWIEWLARFRRPVVWFDFSDTGAALDRAAIPYERFYRCCCNEPSMAELALETCARLGHRAIAFPLYRTYADGSCEWFRMRRQYLENGARKRFPHLALTFPVQDETLWTAFDSDYGSLSGCRSAAPMRGHIDHITRYLREKHRNMPAPAFRERLRQEMRATVPSLADVLSNGQVTAVLAPNQWLAVNYLEWMRAAGVAVPEDISLLAFDNYYDQGFYPVTVVDQNFGELGYKSAHLLIGDIAIQADKAGRIACAPKLIDRGSLGLPRARVGSRVRAHRWR